MDTNRKAIQLKFDKHKGEHVIALGCNKVRRLIAIAEDEDDYLYVYMEGRNIKFEVINCGFIPLKNYIHEKDYAFLVRGTKFNDVDVKDEENIYYRSDQSISDIFRLSCEEMFGVDKRYQLIGNICWELN